MDYTRQEILEAYLDELERMKADRENSRDFLQFYGLNEGLTVVEVPHQRGPNAKKVRRNLGFKEDA